MAAVGTTVKRVHNCNRMFLAINTEDIGSGLITRNRNLSDLGTQEKVQFNLSHKM